MRTQLPAGPRGVGRMLVAISTLVIVTPAAAQWLGHPTHGIPRTADGKPDLAAPAPKTADGKVDLSGLWQPDPRSRTFIGPTGSAFPPPYNDVTADLKPGEVPFRPWAEAEYRRRQERFGADHPVARCQPYGVPAVDAYPAPFKILHGDRMMVILYEVNTTYRQIFLDGRSHPVDLTPTWNGYSVGNWAGDTLVVETTGFNDRSWLDKFGHPHTEAMRVTERFRRSDYGHLEIQVTIDDPQAYTKPLMFTLRQELLADSELLEHFCTDSDRSGRPTR